MAFLPPPILLRSIYHNTLRVDINKGKDCSSWVDFTAIYVCTVLYCFYDVHGSKSPWYGTCGILHNIEKEKQMLDFLCIYTLKLLLNVQEVVTHFICIQSIFLGYLL